MEVIFAAILGMGFALAAIIVVSAIQEDRNRRRRR